MMQDTDTIPQAAYSSGHTHKPPSNGLPYYGCPACATEHAVKIIRQTEVAKLQRQMVVDKSWADETMRRMELFEKERDAALDALRGVRDDLHERNKQRGTDQCVLCNSVEWVDDALIHGKSCAIAIADKVLEGK